MTRRCLQHLKVLNLPIHTQATLILADNGSNEPSTHKGIEDLIASRFPFPIMKFDFDYPFNFSKINNDAYQCAANELKKNNLMPLTHIWFLNNDVMVIDSNAILKLLRASQLPNCGAVGNTLLYPNRKIQHLYAEPFTKIIASHPFKGELLPGNSSWSMSNRIVPAVTGASFFMTAQNFLAVGKFDELLPTLGQDIDLCLKLRLDSKIIISAADLILIHEESSTKNSNFPLYEVEYFYRKWRNFSDEHPRPVLKWSEKPYLSSITWNYPAMLYARNRVTTL
jgi:GT2 family glycosyltransferase